MEKEQKDTVDDVKKVTYYRPSIDRIRLVLMFFMCISMFGFPTPIGSMVKTLSGFSALAFYTISGYLVLRKTDARQARIGRTIKRTAIAFGAMCAFYLLANYFFYRYTYSLLNADVNIFEAFLSKRICFNFLVLNQWPFQIGDSIWYVQALLYAYIIIYFLEKTNVLKYDWLIAVILILFGTCTGELAGVFKWNVLGYEYLPGNFLTRALPYILLGRFLSRKEEKLEKMPKNIFYIGIAVGLIIAIGEMVLLDSVKMSGAYGHLLGMGVMAISASILAFLGCDCQGFETRLHLSRWHINGIYYLSQPLGLGLAALLVIFAGDFTQIAVNYISIAVFLISFAIIICAARIAQKMRRV